MESLEVASLTHPLCSFPDAIVSPLLRRLIFAGLGAYYSTIEEILISLHQIMYTRGLE